MFTDSTFQWESALPKSAMSPYLSLTNEIMDRWDEANNHNAMLMSPQSDSEMLLDATSHRGFVCWSIEANRRSRPSVELIPFR